LGGSTFSKKQIEDDDEGRVRVRWTMSGDDDEEITPANIPVFSSAAELVFRFPWRGKEKAGGLTSFK
jgi:hypothetical protein